MKRVIKTERDELEWIYIPDITYCEYGDVKRRLQLIVPYRQEWKGDRKYPLVVFIPGSAWYRQEMYNGIPALSRLAEKGMIVAAIQYRESTKVWIIMNWKGRTTEERHFGTTRLWILSVILSGNDVWKCS